MSPTEIPAHLVGLPLVQTYKTNLFRQGFLSMWEQQDGILPSGRDFGSHDEWCQRLGH